MLKNYFYRTNSPKLMRVVLGICEIFNGLILVISFGNVATDLPAKCCRKIILSKKKK